MTAPHAVTENRMHQITARTADAIVRLIDDMHLSYEEVDVSSLYVYGSWFPTEATRKRPKRGSKKPLAT